MSLPDLVNGAFEGLGGLMVLNHCRAVVRDRGVRGASFASASFFWFWGGWNLYYYPTLGQWSNFAGGVVLTLANLLYLALWLHYARVARRDEKLSKPRPHV